ncbi:IS1634 family transposase [Basilea psittacipulmonis]|uniref:Transposase IS4-like domain-containing protein n=2 Tax=Basilea TaxID=1472344 RepID=A0A077DBY6_9BURK|nr:transposase [Basilea psittacipulmonis]AIL32169.1 hypothetical protein IX83_01530 [Basilea psittacipulmonis DSM 24701]
MAYLNQLATLPDKNITYLKYKDTYYVIYNYAYKRNANGNPQSKKITIGKLVDKKSRLFQPNENYLKVYDKPQFIKEEVDCSKIPLSAVKYTRPEGLLQLVQTIAKELELDVMLRKVFGSDHHYLMSLATYMLCCGNVMKGYERWANKHYLPTSLCMNDKRISDIFSQVITQEKRHQFLDLWSQKASSENFLAYDSTSISTSSSIIEAKLGFNKENDKTKQINLGILYGYDSRLPFNYSWYQGNIVDKSYLKFMLSLTKNLKDKKITFVMDQGYFSSDNLKTIDELGNKFITFLPRNTNLSRQSIDEISELKLGYTDLVPGFKTVKCRTISSELTGMKCNLHVFLDPDKQIELQSDFEEYLQYEEKALQDKIKEKVVTKKTCKYFKIHQEGKTEYSYERDIEKISYEYNRLGYFVLITNNLDLTSGEVLEAYRGKDLIEKAFCDIKTNLDSRRLRTQRSETTNGKIFVMFIALILLSALRNRIRHTEIEYKYSLTNIIEELDDIKLFVTDDEKVLHPLTTDQVKILNELNLDIKV